MGMIMVWIAAILVVLVEHILTVLILIHHIPHMFRKSYKSTIDKLKINDLMTVVNEELIKVRYIANSKIKNEA